jgi:hypothetical protein
MSYYEKYLKYKNKYLELKYNFQQKGGVGEIYEKKDVNNSDNVINIRGDTKIKFEDGRFSTFHETYLYMLNLSGDGESEYFYTVINTHPDILFFKEQFIKSSGSIYLLELHRQPNKRYYVQLKPKFDLFPVIDQAIRDIKLGDLIDKEFNKRPATLSLNNPNRSTSNRGIPIFLAPRFDDKLGPLTNRSFSPAQEPATQYKPAPVPTIEEMFIPYHASDTGKHLFGQHLLGRKPYGLLYTNPAPAAAPAPTTELEMFIPYHASPTGKSLLGRRPDGSFY